MDGSQMVLEYTPKIMVNLILSAIRNYYNDNPFCLVQLCASKVLCFLKGKITEQGVISRQPGVGTVPWRGEV
jgi:hypothetical protein